MNITFPKNAEALSTIQAQPDNSLQFVFLISGALNQEAWQQYLVEVVRVLQPGGVLFVQGRPYDLPSLGVYLDQHLTFKYWFAVESNELTMAGLPSVHAGVMLFIKGNGRVNLQRTRLPHQMCQACGRTLKDWGGKAHLMHPDGYAISDVIKDLPTANNYTQISKPLYELLLSTLDFRTVEIKGMVLPQEGCEWQTKIAKEPAPHYQLPLLSLPPKVAPPKINIDPNQFNVIHHSDALEILRQYPDESVDLVFADPPYNLDKEYTVYEDGQAEQIYLQWCNEWLSEYVRLLKPTGSLFVLNLPRWAVHHADFLNKHLYFQNWIVWDALSEPRGKIMPAHYALLFYTKHPTQFTFNYDQISPIDARHYCLRASCRRQRKGEGDDKKTAVTDIWWDIHRIKHRRDRDHHPCQLPDPLMERIIRLATNPNDIVLDAFAGVGTTPVVAHQLGRRYIAIDLDPNYIEIMHGKMAQLAEQGFIYRPSVSQPSLPETKKALQVELRELTVKLGRLPTPEDVQDHSQYDLSAYYELFPTWGKALKAAKLETDYI